MFVEQLGTDTAVLLPGSQHPASHPLAIGGRRSCEADSSRSPLGPAQQSSVMGLSTTRGLL